ncbi:MAG: hypothetical protein QM758_24580 [Armatimonas sp.]
MQKKSPLALLPLCCLAMAASAAHLFNKNRDAAVSPNTPAITARPVKNPHTQQELEVALRQIVQNYRESGFDSLKDETTQERWHHWQVTTTGTQVNRRMERLASWPDVSVQAPQVRPSGHTEVLATYGEDQLKVWMVHKGTGWKLLGIVTPTVTE